MFQISCRFLKLAKDIPSRAMSSSVFDEKIIKLDGKTINYLKTGEGPVVFCLPGALGTIWSDFKPQIEKLSQSLTVLAWDPPGYGKSMPPSRDFSGHFFDRDAQTAISLLDNLKIDKFSILGWSDGGITGLVMAGKYPSRIDKTIVWGANAYVTEDDVKLYEGIRDTSKWSERMREPLEKTYGKEKLSQMMSDWVDAMIRYKENDGDICRSQLSQIKSPTLVIHGDKDPLVPHQHPKYLIENIKNSKYHSFPDGKHNLHLKYSDEFNKIVIDFIK